MELGIENTVYIVVDVLIGFVAIVGNLLVCYVIFGNRKFRNSPMYLLIASLAIGDILVGAFTIPFGILARVGLPHDKPYLCLVMTACTLAPALVSVNSLLAVSIERYFAIRYPFFHLDKFNRKISLIMISVSWIIAICFGFLPVFGWNIVNWSQSSNDDIKQYDINNTYTTNQPAIMKCIFVQVIDPDYLVVNSMIGGIIPLMICIPLYLLIYLHVKKSDKMLVSNGNKSTPSKSNIQTTETNIKSTTESVEITSSAKTKRIKDESFENTKKSKKSVKSKADSDDYKKQKSRIRRKKEIHIAVVLGLTVLAFAVCWLPLQTINLASKYSSTPLNISGWLVIVVILLTHVNSAINIFLYSWRIKAFRKELHRKVFERLGEVLL